MESELNATQGQSHSSEIEPRNIQNSCNSFAAFPIIVNETESSIPIDNSIELPADHYLTITLRKGKRSCTTHLFSNQLSYVKLSQNHSLFVTKVTNLFIPKNIKESLEDPDCHSVVMENLNTLEKNRTWDLVNMPKG